MNKYNLVVHESDLPLRKGWSPLSWQILEGKNKFPITLFEAKEKLDSGDIYCKTYLDYNGSELFDELKIQQGIKTKELIFKFIEDLKFNRLKNKRQNGIESFYSRRTPQDSIIDPNKSIKTQFNLLRIADPQNYPNFFTLNGCRYKIIIEKYKGH